ncbi:c-type cytochrome [Bisbaumannia pacifica]|uniref:Cytochrome c5 family protein n=1 Tax=Bisbaumannia pacifica TaxID=77098 RepID=A0ABD4L270_9GAMM|nr:cytochrome c5 family protein [Halomonas pacifica]
MKSSKLIMGCLAALGLAAGLATTAQAQSDSEREAIAERLAPVGQLCLQGEECGIASAAPSGGSSGGAVDGAEVYGSVCMACHDTGAAGAPKRGEADAWAARLDQGIETLYTHAINGFNAMPARGGNPNLSDDEVKAAVNHLVEPVFDGDLPAIGGGEATDDAAAETAAAAESGGSDLDGEALYGSSGCAACHGAGVAGAPVLGDAEAWGPRIDQGVETLYQSALNGKGAMPPKGGNAGLADEEVMAIVDYMVSQAQ